MGHGGKNKMPNEFERGACLPLIQSVIVGFFVGLIMAGIAIYLIWSSYWGVALSIGSMVALWWFSTSIQLWRNDVYSVPYAPPEQVEQVVPQPPVQPINIHMGSQIKFTDLPCTPTELHEFVTRLLDDAPFTEKEWTGDGNLFSKAEFGKIRKLFIDRGWAYWRNPKYPAQGCNLSSPGRLVCQQIIEELRA
jgi:hypothetical protein